MNTLNIIPYILIIIGAFLNYIVPIIIKKKSNDLSKIYITKTIGLILVIIGCIMVFWLGGKFGV